MKLISMTEFVLKTHNTIEDVGDSEWAMYKYANFLNQPLTLGMFVPCDEDGNVLEEPIYKEYCNCDQLDNYDNLVVKYQQAKDKVIFEGFENYFFELKEHNVFVINEKIFSTNDKIENLLEYKGLEFKLTPNAIKQLELWI